MKKLILLPLLLFGCATSAKFDSQAQTWVGQDINKYISRHGQPMSTFKMPNGNDLYTWKELGNARTVANTNQITSTWQTTNVTASQDSCELSFEVDSLSTIKSYRWVGNMCVAK